MRWDGYIFMLCAVWVHSAFLPSSIINILPWAHLQLNIVSVLCFFVMAKHKLKDLILTDILYQVHKLFVFRWFPFFVCARLLRLQYFTLASETKEIINMTCQTIEHNDLSLIPVARDSLMSLLQKIDVFHTEAVLAQTQRASRGETESSAHKVLNFSPDPLLCRV